jgi:hypothetical protein
MKPSIIPVVAHGPEATPPDPLPPFPEDPALRERLERIFAGLEPPPTIGHSPEVLQQLEQQLALTPDLPAETQRRLLDEWSLSYHHGGQHVLTWQSPQGLAVLAVGLEEAARAQQHLAPDRVLEVRGRFVEPW